MLGPVDGERLTKLIHDGVYTWNAPFAGRISQNVGGPAVVATSGALLTIPLPGGAKVHLLSPSGPKLKRVPKVWETVLRDAHLMPGAGTDKPARLPPPRHVDVPPIAETLTRDELAALTAETDPDRSAANGSSIAFLFEYGGQRAPLGAEAHADTLVPALRRFGNSLGEERVRVHLFKL